MNESSGITTAVDLEAWWAAQVAAHGEYDTWDGATTDMFNALHSGLPAEEQRIYRRRGMAARFTPEHLRVDHRCVHLAPGGQYRLVVDIYGTGWCYSRGEVFRCSDEQSIAVIERNYSSFPFCWVLRDGEPAYLFGGEDYQGSTCIELATGRAWHFYPAEAEKGHGFCWSPRIATSRDQQTLLVDGCYWACPYEYRFYDISDPMNGWPEIVAPAGLDLHAEGHAECVERDDGLFEWTNGERVFIATGERFESEIEMRSYDDATYPDPDVPANAHLWARTIDERIVLRREGLTLVVVEHTKSEWQQERERKRAEWQERERAQRAAWIEKDPLVQWLLVQKLGGAELQKRLGFSYPGGPPQPGANPATFSLSYSEYDPNKTRRQQATIVWGVEHGPIRVKRWKYGKGDVDTLTFDRIEMGMHLAWQAAAEWEAGG